MFAKARVCITFITTWVMNYVYQLKAHFISHILRGLKYNNLCHTSTL
jgi:hypothetical protein